MAVYTKVGDEELSAFVASYDIGSVVSVIGVEEGVENTNYLMKTTKGQFILTLYEKRVKPSDLPFFLELKEHLAAKGILCPVPFRSRDGNIFNSLCDRPAAIVTFLEGKWPRSINTHHCSELGSALAKLHLAGLDFTRNRANNLSVNSWQTLLAASMPGINYFEPNLVGELKREIAFLEKNWPCNLPQGLIHADLFPDNVFFRFGELSGLIDFYFACQDMLAYDIAVCINAWCFNRDGNFDVNKSKSMLEAYSDIRSLLDAEVTALPILTRGAATRFLLTRLYDWLYTPVGALVKKKDPIEFRDKLRYHQSVSGPSCYGLN